MTLHSLDSLGTAAMALPCVAADRLARIIEKHLAPAVLAGKRPHVEFHAVAYAAKAGIPAEAIRKHHIVAGLAALERLG